MIFYTTKNGIKVYIEKMPAAESIALDLYVNAGSRDETPDNNGIAHLLEHMHFRRLDNLDQKEIYYLTESMGATLEASASVEMLRFYIKFRPNHLSKILDLFIKIVEMDKWTETDLEQERAVVINEIIENDSYYNIDRYVKWDLWKNHPLSLPVLGTEESVSGITLNEIVEHKKNAFRKDNMFFIISGRLTKKDTELINNKISGIHLAEGGELQPRTAPSHGNKPIVSFVKTNNDFLDVVISFKKDYGLVEKETLLLLSSIIGGGYGAILQTLVREELGLVYNIYSEVNSYEDTTTFQIKCGVHKKYFMKVLNVVFSAINDTKANIDTNDMMSNIPFYTENTWFLKEDPTVFNENIGWEIFIRSVDNDPIKQMIDKYMSITKENVMDVAKALFTAENTNVVVMGATGRYTKKEVRENIHILDKKAFSHRTETQP